MSGRRALSLLTGGRRSGWRRCTSGNLRPDPGVVPVRRGYLQALIVARSHRNTGVGSALLTAAEDWARLRGAIEMELDHWVFPDGPGEFYEQAGYRVLSEMRVRPLE